MMDAGKSENIDLFYAAQKGNAELVKRLFEKSGIRVNDTDDSRRTALMIAAAKGHITIAGLLIGKGADVNATDYEGNTALISAIKAGYVNTAKLLIEKGADVTIANNKGMTALIYADRNGYPDLAGYITEHLPANRE